MTHTNHELANRVIQCGSQAELDELVRAYKSSRKPCLSDVQNHIYWYLRHWEIEAVVLGVSGGIDSAVVGGLVTGIRDLFPGLEVHCLNLTYPIFDKVYDPRFAYEANLYLAKRGARVHSARVLDELRPSPQTSSEALGDIAYQHRYHLMFAYTRNLNKRAVTFGTSNYDELAYAGWFGKTSDMMVDVQPISYLHKFEVVELAKQLGVPQSIIDRAPTGDLISGKSDEDCFGVTYDELALLSMATDQPYCWGLGLPVVKNTWSYRHFQKVHKLHEKNAHKYQKPFTHYNPIFLGW